MFFLSLSLCNTILGREISVESLLGEKKVRIAAVYNAFVRNRWSLMISFLSLSLSVFSKRNVRSRRQFREPLYALYPFPIRKFADWTFDRISPGYILKFQCPFDRSRSNGYRWIFYRARFVLLLDVQKGRGKRKTNSTIIESSIRLGSIFQSRYYLPAATFISRCDSVATVLIPSFPPFFFLFPFSEVFDIYFLAWRRFHRSYRTDRSNIHRSVQLPSSKPVIISYSRSHRIAVSINVT